MISPPLLAERPDSAPIGDLSPLLSVRDALRLIGVGRTTLYARLAAGELTAFKVGRRTLFRTDELRAWIESLPRLGDNQSPKSGE